MSDFDFSQFEHHLLAFESEWRDTESVDLKSFVDRRNQNMPTECLVELAKIDFEHRLNRDIAKSIDEYWQLFSELRNDLIRKDLIEYEFRLRKKLDQELSVEELQTRFNEQELNWIDQLSQTLVGYEATQVGSIIESISTGWDETIAAGAHVHQYTIEQQIGSGAFAMVYRATDNRLRRSVALKFLRSGLSQSKDARKRMLLEAQAVSSFQHSNIVPVFEVGQFHNQDFIASRYVDGQTLERSIQNEEFDIPASIGIVSQLADAVSHAHSRGVIHRDIKPANIMIENGQPLLLDFGLAHFTDSSIKLTNVGDVVGTPAYMAPEQADGRAWQSDPRTDVYGLGVLLYQMVTRRLPFYGTTAEVIHQVIHKEAISPRKYVKNVDRDIETIILKCLEKDPKDRYQSAAALHDDLQRYLTGNSILARPSGLIGGAIKWSRRRPVVATMSALLVLGSAFLIGMASQIYRVSQQRDEARSARAETQLAKFKLQEQLAVEAADAGQLAMQRGQMKNAIEFFDRSIEMGHTNPVDLRFMKLESLVVLRQLNRAHVELEKIVSELDSASGDNSTESTDKGRILLWQAELAMDGIGGYDEPVALLESSANHKLDLSDQMYRDAMLAETSGQALELFRQTVENDTFHHRARKMLITMLVGLARFDEALGEIQIAQQLFPEDGDFELFRALVLAANGDIDSSAASLKSVQLEASQLDRWQQLCNDLNQVCNELIVFPGVIGYSDKTNHRIVTRFGKQHLPLIRSRGWRFPPVIGEQISNHFANLLPELSITKVNPEDADKAIEILDRLIQIHEEGTLNALYAEQLLTKYNLLDATNAKGGGKELDSQLVQDAASAFEQSITLPGFVKSVKETSWVGVLGSSMALYHRHQIDVKENQQRFINAANSIDPKSIGIVRNLRAISVGLITLEAYDQSVRWCDRWVEVAGKDNLDAVWHRIVLDRWRERWLEVLRQSTEAIERFPDFEPLQGLQGRAKKELNTELKKVEIN